MSERMSSGRLAALRDDWAIYGTLDGGLGDELYEALIAERAEVERLRNELAKHQDGGVWKESNQANIDNHIAYQQRLEAEVERLNKLAQLDLKARLQTEYRLAAAEKVAEAAKHPITGALQLQEALAEWEAVKR